LHQYLETKRDVSNYSPVDGIGIPLISDLGDGCSGGCSYGRCPDSGRANHINRAVQVGAADDTSLEENTDVACVTIPPVTAALSTDGVTVVTGAV